MKLPESEILPVKYISNIFKNTTNSYKFYWFVSILDSIIKSSNRKIRASDLIAGMISSIWYPANFFKISFGKQDRLGEIAFLIKDELNLNPNSDSTKIFTSIVTAIVDDNKIINSMSDSLLKFVPYRFLRPWFYQELRGIDDHKINAFITDLADKNFNNTDKLPIYRLLFEDCQYIEINEIWFDYFKKHYRILRDFCYWNLLIYLQNKNPNVPNIANKLFAPKERKLINARKFWDIVLEKKVINNCIYSDVSISLDNYTIDHFIPWRFVTHDLLWNLVPVPKEINSTKSDAIPSLDNYLEKFSKIQFLSFRTVYESKNRKLLEDYSGLFNCKLETIYSMPTKNFISKIIDTIIPLTQIAENMGFQTNWMYQ